MTAAPSIFGSEPAALTSFSESARTDGPDFAAIAHVGKTAAFVVEGVKQITTTHYGVKPAIACPTVHVVSPDGTGTTFEDVLIFNTAIVDQLKQSAGQTVVAKIGVYRSRTGKDAPRLESPDAAAVDAAAAYIKSKG